MRRCRRQWCTKGVCIESGCALRLMTSKYNRLEGVEGILKQRFSAKIYTICGSRRKVYLVRFGLFNFVSIKIIVIAYTIY